MKSKIKYTIIASTLVGMATARQCPDDGTIRCTFEAEYESSVIPGEVGRVSGTLGGDDITHGAVCNRIWDDECGPSKHPDEYSKWVGPCWNAAVAKINPALAIGTYNELVSFKIIDVTNDCNRRIYTMNCEGQNLTKNHACSWHK